MVSYRFAAFIGLTAALPLNINLGAYSPALVVGDGEISFGGKQDVSNLMNALEGAAVSAASNANAVAAQAQSNPAVVQAAAADPALSEQAQQIATLQGLGRAQRLPTTNNMAKRDLAGFDRALRYAEAALTKGPDIQLGTGAEGSGIGIIVDNQPTAERKAEKRSVDESATAASAPRRRAKVTTMYVRRGIPASLMGSSEEVEAREVPLTMEARSTAPQPVSRRGDAIDAVNLNVDGNAGLTMTFVETVDADEED